MTGAGQISGEILNAPTAAVLFDDDIGTKSTNLPLTPTQNTASIEVFVQDSDGQNVGIGINWLEGNPIPVSGF